MTKYEVIYFVNINDLNIVNRFRNISVELLHQTHIYLFVWLISSNN